MSQSDAHKQQEHTNSTQTKLYRLPKSGKVAGVCAGLAAYFDIDVTVMRLIFVVLTLASAGFGVVLYIVLAVIMPTAESSAANGNGTDIEHSIDSLAHEMRDNGAVDRLRNFFGIALIALGAWLVAVQFFPRWFTINWALIWPVALIALGLVMMIRSKK